MSGDQQRYVEISAGETTWRFERDFVESDWHCIFGAGCHGILPERSSDFQQGCCSYGAHLGDGAEGRAEALDVAAYASVLTADQWQWFDELRRHGPSGIFADDNKTHTRVIDGACIFLNRPDFTRGAGCALHVGAVDAGESPIEWKPSVCWQLPIRVDWETRADGDEVATVRRWRRTDWGEFGNTMAWCCTERDEGAEAYTADAPVIDTLGSELAAVAGEEVVVELRARLTDDLREIVKES